MILQGVFVNDLLGSRLVSRRVRLALLRRVGMRLASVRISADVIFSGTNVTVADGTFINYGGFIDGAGSVTIGRDCDLGQRVSVHSISHQIGATGRRAGVQLALPTVIGDRVWLGAGAMVPPGVTVGAGCVVAAGAVVARDCSPDGLYAGVPARRVRDLPVADINSSGEQR